MIEIPEKIITTVSQYAEEAYPKECCGLVFGPSDQAEACTRVYPCQNVQDEFHQKDPKTYPRTAAEAFTIHPEVLLKAFKEARDRSEELRVIYHSHVDTEAYLSKEDERFALLDGEPTYPGVFHLIISVIEGWVRESRLFGWNDKKGEFVSLEED